MYTDNWDMRNNSLALSLPLHSIRINREQEETTTQDELVIATNFSGTLKFCKIETMQEQIAEKMEQLSSKKLIRKTVSSHQVDRGKQDGMTVRGHRHDDVPMCVLRQWHAHQIRKTTTRTTTTNTKTTEVAAKSKSSSSKNDSAKKKKNSELPFDINQQNARSLHSGDRFEELLKEVKGCKWDAILLTET